MSIHELLRKDPDIVPEEAPLVILDIKSAVFMVGNFKDTKHTRNTARRVHFKVMLKIKKYTRFTGVKEVCNWQTLQIRMLARMI